MKESYRILLALLAAGLLAGLAAACSQPEDESDKFSYLAAAEATSEPWEVAVITDNASSLAAVATDESGVSYWFYAVRNAEGEPDYISEFILTRLEATGIAELIDITFDEQQRVTGVTLPDLQGSLGLDYASASEVVVRVTTPTGLSETLSVPNPYTADSVFTLARATALQEAFCRDWAGFPADDVHTWIGLIEACAVGPVPQVIIGPLYPGDVGHMAQVRELDESLPGYYAYTYQVAWVDDYALWESYCLCMKNVTCALLAGDTVFPLFNIGHTLCNLAEGILTDLMGATETAEVEAVLTATGEQLSLNGLPGTVVEVADCMMTSGDPCSRQQFDLLRNDIFQPQKIQMKYSDVIKTIDFYPLEDEKIEQVSFAELCCGDVTEAGGDTPESHEHELGLTRGEFVFAYETYTVKDHMVVLYEGSTLFDTGCVGTQGYRSTTIRYAGNSHKVTVHVLPNCEGYTSGTAWEYQITCPVPIEP